MTIFSIEYNPYKVHNTFRLNGETLSKTSKFESNAKRRFQELLEKDVNWDGLLEEIIKICDDDKIAIHFKGRKIDYDDLQYVLENYKGKIKFISELDEIHNESDVMKRLDNIMKKIRQMNIPEFKEKNDDGKDVFEIYEEIWNRQFKVNVIAPVGSGKSTLINSLLQKGVLPAENEACTTMITEILNNDDMTQFNSNKKVKTASLQENIPAIASDKIRLFLMDTTETNNSRNKEYEHITKAMIKEKNVFVLYILNAQYLWNQDDVNFLEDIAEEMRSAGKQPEDKFIFVLNKMDELDGRKGETVEKILVSAREYLKEKGIENPILIPTSARIALLIRKRRNDEKLTREEEQEWNTIETYVTEPLLHFEEFATLPPAVQQKLKHDVQSYHADEENWDLEALVHTGIPAIEYTLQEYIEKYVYPTKIQKSIQEIIGILTGLDMKGKFLKSIEDNWEKLSDAKEQENGRKIYEQYHNAIMQMQIRLPVPREEKKLIKRALAEETKRYDHLLNVREEEADRIIYPFIAKLRDFQKRYIERICVQIEDEVYQKCNDKQREYKESVNKIFPDIDVAGFEFSKVHHLRKMEFSNFASSKQRNRKVCYRDEKRRKKNPEKKGVFGFFKFEESGENYYIEKVVDHIEVNVKNIIDDMSGDLAEHMESEIEEIGEEANEQVEEYKSVFIHNLNHLDKEITKIVKQSEVEIGDPQKIRNKIREDEEKIEKVDKVRKELDQLLE